jgi:hypothetical protein
LKRQFVTTLKSLLNILFKPGSRCDSQLPAIARQCRAFALESNHQENGERLGQKSDSPESVDDGCSEPMIIPADEGTNPLEDEEEEEETRPGT